MKPALSVQVLQWGHTDFTCRAVAAVQRSEYDGPIEILVRDNASPGGPGQVASLDGVVFVQGSQNIGFGPGHNELVRRARGDLLVILNNDSIVDRCALARLVDRYGEPDRPGVVTPQYREAGGRVLEMGGYIGSAGDGWQLFRDQPPPVALQRLPYPSTYGSAACLLLSRADFLRLGGFDKSFAPAYYEDADLCMRLGQLGRPTVVEPRAIVYHFEGTTSGRRPDQGAKSFQARNRTRFVNRWHGALAARSSASFSSAVTEALAPPAPGGLRVLWLGSHLPQPDREAGWLRTVSMIEALHHAGDGLAVWAEHCLSPGRYGRLLEQAGIPWFGAPDEKRWGPPVDSGPMRSLVELLDTVPWDLVIVAFPHIAVRLVPIVRDRLPRVPVLVDAVDLHFLRYDRAKQLGVGVQGMLSKEDELAVYRAADGVIVASAHEAEHLAQLLPGVMTWTYTMAAPKPVALPDGNPRNLLFLGNFMHPPNADAIDWWVHKIGPAAERLAGTPLPLRVVGNGSETLRGRWNGRAAESVDIAGWVRDLKPEFMAARAFIAPLRYGAGTKGKILAALAHGIPVITTSVGAEGNHAAVSAGLSVADDADELARLVVRMMTDDDAWVDARQRAIDASHAAWRYQRALDAEFTAWVHRRAALIT